MACVLLVAAIGSTITLMLRYRIAWHAAALECQRLRNKQIDWPQLKFYADANAALLSPGPTRVVFIGDSITQQWDLPKFFPGLETLNRGIGWQTTSEMLVRLRQDALDLHPSAIVVLGGTNDFHIDFGPMPLVSTQGNIQSMIELARQHDIAILVGTIPSVCFEKRGISQKEFDLASMARYNEWLRTLCTGKYCTLVDYDDALHNSGEPFCTYLRDGVHPTDIGYEAMARSVRDALNRVIATGSGLRGH
jgi:lysophospholipase L1-like esterase